MANWRVGAVVVAVVVACSFGAPAPALTQSDAEIEEALRVFNRGKRFHQEKRYREAIKEYRAALKLDNLNAFIYNSLGLALAAIGDLKGALKSLEKAIEINPDRTDVFNNLGMVYNEMGERDNAFDAFTRAVRNMSYPTPEKALFNLGNLYLEERNFELALMHFNRAAERNRKFALAFRGIGNTYRMMGDLERAEENFEKVLVLFQDDVQSLFYIAQLSQQRGDKERAMEFYRRVVEVDRLSAYGRLSLQTLESMKEGTEPLKFE